jgi:hypothetical protein
VGLLNQLTYKGCNGIYQLTSKGYQRHFKIMPRVSTRAPLEVIMVPLQNKRVIGPSSFPPMPRLYLELLENKEKIKKEYTTQEFVPKYDTEVVFDEDGDEKVYTKPPDKTTSKAPVKATMVPVKEPPKKLPLMNPSTKAPAKSDMKKPILDAANVSRESNESFESPPMDETVLHDDITGVVDIDPLSSFLKKSRSIGSREHGSSSEKKVSYDRNKDDLLRNDANVPPSLQDIEDGGAFDSGGIKNAARVSKKEQDGESKLREYLFKYTLLRKSYPTEDIPKFTINSDPEFVAKTYDEILRNLSLTDNVNKYKKYLMFGFMGVEALVGNVLGFDMKGFTKQQIVEMASYEKLIIELGEKTYVPKSNWPVELRLLGMIIMNAAFFIASKMALRATGTDVLGNMNNAATAGVTAANIQQRKSQRMSGPNINLDDIPGSEPKAPSPAEKDGVTFVSR